MLEKLKTKTRAIAIVAAVVAILPFGVAVADSGEVVVHVGTGDWAEANIEAYVKPFEKATGIKVVSVKDWFSYAKLKLWQESGRAEVDVTSISTNDGALANKNGWLVPVDYTAFDPAIASGLTDAAKKPWGVGALYYSIALSYFNDLPGGKAPSNWAEFWNTKAFPGKRTMYSGKYGPGMWEIALMADGVAPKDLYPIDFDRATKSLDKIRDHVVKWWEDGSDNQQLFADRFVDMGPAFNGRIGNLQKKGMALTIEWNQGLALIDYWAIPKGAPNAESAQKFIQFVSRPDRQADFSSRIPYGPTNVNAYKHLDPELARTLPSHPDLLPKLVTVDAEWYVQDNGGKTNLEIAIERWNKWRLE